MVPKVRIARFKTEEEANIFQLNCLYKGWTICSVYKDSEWVIRYVEHQAKVEVLTVQQVITKNEIEDFNITFLNGLMQPIINPNYNILAEIPVKTLEVDWLRRKAKITVVTL